MTKNIIPLALITIFLCNNCVAFTDYQSEFEICNEETKQEFANLKEDENCEITIYHQTQHTERGTFVSPDGHEYKVQVDYEKEEDFLDNHYTPQDIGMLAHLSINSYQEKGYEEQGWSKTSFVRSKLSNIYVFVTSTRNEFTRLTNSRLYDKNPELACQTQDPYLAIVFSVKMPCHKNIPEEANIAYIIRKQYMSYDNIDVSIHELMHPIGRYGFADSDGDHDDPKLWTGLNKKGEEDISIMTDVIQKYNQDRPFETPELLL